MLAIYVEASHARGMGHLFRALALAEALEGAGEQVHFCLNAFPPALDLLKSRTRGFTIVNLDESGWEQSLIQDHGIGVWINDRLDTGADHAAAVARAGARLVTFDDRGAGAAAADLNIVAFPATDRESLPGRRVLSGPQALVLDPAICRLRRKRTALGSMVVSMGGSDTYGVTIDVVRALKLRGAKATVILGPGFAHDQALAELVDDAITVKRNVPSLAEEFAAHDFAVTAGGVTPCEANAAGLPCAIIATETWEERVGAVLEGLGGSLFAGHRQSIDFGFLDRALPVAAMSQAALQSVPCDGAQRVAREILAS